MSAKKKTSLLSHIPGMRTFKAFFVLIVLVIVLLLIVIFASGRGGDLKSFLASVPTIAASMMKEAEVKKNDSGKTEPVVHMATIQMRFVNDILFLENYKCQTSKDFDEAIKKIRQKYPSQNILVDYKETAEDPYIDARDARDKLKEHGFSFIRKSKNP